MVLVAIFTRHGSHTGGNATAMLDGVGSTHVIAVLVMAFNSTDCIPTFIAVTSGSLSLPGGGQYLAISSPSQRHQHEGGAAARISEAGNDQDKGYKQTQHHIDQVSHT